MKTKETGTMEDRTQKKMGTKWNLKNKSKLNKTGTQAGVNI